MKNQVTTLAITLGLFGLAGPVIADHNSKNGEGWANMPNDIHNTRVETLENDDNEAFRDFVKNGEGSKTVNRFDSDDTQSNKANRHGSRSAGEPARPVDASQKEVRKKTPEQNQARGRSRSRLESSNSRMSRSASGQTSMRGGGRRGGGRK